MKSKTLLATTGVLAMLAGCSSLAPSQVAKRATEMKDVIETSAALHAASMAEKPLYARIKGIYIGTDAMPLPTSAAIPAAISDIGFRLKARTNLASAAKRITAQTGYPFRINPDVYINPRALVAGMSAQQQASTQHAKLDNGVNGSLLSADVEDLDTSLPADFDGKLRDYLDQISAHLNITCDFDPSKGFYCYRMVTKTFEVKLNAGVTKYNSGITKGGSTSVGSAGTANGGSSGSFTVDTSASVNVDYAAWDQLNTALKSLASPIGKITVDVASSSVVVKDTKDAVEDISRLIERTNAFYTRQIYLSLRVLRVAYDDTLENGITVNAIYQRLAGGIPELALSLNSPSTLTTGNTGDIGVSILSPTSRWRGTNSLVQALSELGNVISDETTAASTLNREPVPLAQFETESYLAETTPAAGAATGGGTGVPGLKPGSVTTGFFVYAVPTAFDNSSVLLRLALDQSQLKEILAITTGEGVTRQQIQLPNTRGNKSNHSVGLKEGESVVLTSIVRDNTTTSSRSALTGFSNTGRRTRELQVVIVTPQVRQGV